MKLHLLSIALALAPLALADAPAARQPLRAGMIGLDTSHVIAFTELFNRAEPGSELAGIRIVAGYPGGTDVPASRDRVGRFTQMVREKGVEIVDTIPALLTRVDVVLLESVDGRIHLEEAIPVIRAGKPLFIDKPVAGSLADAITIFGLAEKHGVPCFSSSTLRFAPTVHQLRTNPELGEIIGAATWGPCSYESGVPDMYFYGIHGIEALFVLMGTGCESVSRTQTKDTDQLTGVWSGGRIGTYRGLRAGKTTFGAVAYGTAGVVHQERGIGGYEPLCREIARFFRTGKPPVSAAETIELFAFMTAADESKRSGGAPVALASVLRQAQVEADAKLAQLR